MTKLRPKYVHTHLSNYQCFWIKPTLLDKYHNLITDLADIEASELAYWTNLLGQLLSRKNFFLNCQRFHNYAIKGVGINC